MNWNNIHLHRLAVATTRLVQLALIEFILVVLSLVILVLTATMRKLFLAMMMAQD
jgi:hypothetical protein